MGKFHKLKHQVQKSTFHLMDRSAPNAQFVVVNAQGVSNLIKQQQLLIDLLQESLQSKWLWLKEYPPLAWLNNSYS